MIMDLREKTENSSLQVGRLVGSSTYCGNLGIGKFRRREEC
jgi:hypothetical protein